MIKSEFLQSLKEIELFKERDFNDRYENIKKEGEFYLKILHLFELDIKKRKKELKPELIGSLYYDKIIKKVEELEKYSDFLTKNKKIDKNEKEKFIKFLINEFKEIEYNKKLKYFNNDKKGYDYEIFVSNKLKEGITNNKVFKKFNTIEYGKEKGMHDKGVDIIAYNNEEIWLIQCKNKEEISQNDIRSIESKLINFEKNYLANELKQRNVEINGQKILYKIVSPKDFDNKSWNTFFKNHTITGKAKYYYISMKMN